MLFTGALTRFNALKCEGRNRPEEPRRGSEIVDRDELKSIITEELQRALHEAGPMSGTKPSFVASAVSRSPNEGLVVFTGDSPPDPETLGALRTLQTEGMQVVAVPSHTFRQTVLLRHSAALNGLEVLDAPEDENALGDRFGAAGWFCFPDVSANTLAKSALGIQDSVPSRGIGHAIGAARPCLFVESQEAPFAGPRSTRHSKLRELTLRGATLTTSEQFATTLHEQLLACAGSPGLVPGSQVRRIITAEDIVAASRQGLAELVVESDAILTDHAVEEAERHGIMLRRAGGGR